MQSSGGPSPIPGQEIFEAAKIASSMPTALWFTDEDRKLERLKNVIACGQFTTCYNLLDYLQKLEKDEIELGSDGLKIKVELENDWKKFVKDPYFLFNQLV
jgi:hypothetical protein